MTYEILRKTVLPLVLLFALPAVAAGPARQVMEPPQYVRGNVNVYARQPIDSATWIWLDHDKERCPQMLRFRKTFRTVEGEPRLRLYVSADERYVLYFDGEEIGRGPDRGLLNNWTARAYELDLAPGEHRLEAVCWRHGWRAPQAQVTRWRGGFILKADGAYHRSVTTGETPWEVGVLAATQPAALDYGACGCAVRQEGTGFADEQPAKWEQAKTVDWSISCHGNRFFGERVPTWEIYPTQLKEQTAERVRPGAFRAAHAVFGTNEVYAAGSEKDPAVAGLNALLREGRAFTVPPRTRLQAAWDLGNYYCVYPELGVSGGRGAEIRLGWTESAVNGSDGFKDDRSAIVDKRLKCIYDTFVSDGRELARFNTQWWRCGRWAQLEVQTADEPLVLKELSLVESRYPLEDHAEFRCDDPTVEPIRRICVRGMQMCAHEMLFDCPYYEQQMYGGDTRVQLQVLRAMGGADELIRRAVELYDFDRRESGMLPMRCPTRGIQESGTYTLCCMLMLGDYARETGSDAWLKARLPGLRHTMSALDALAREDGLLVNVPGWPFVDWVPAWGNEFGCPPDSRSATDPNAQVNLFWVLALSAAADVESLVGDPEMAALWRRKAETVRAAIRAVFWDAKRGLVADTVRHDAWSEHSQSLAILSDVLPKADAERVFENLVRGAPDLQPCSVYFSYYLFEAFFRFGRGDLFLKRLDLWRSYVQMDLKTPLEEPGRGARSDCHAWGSHPLWFFATGLAGIRSAEPGFGRVVVAPSPGSLRHLAVRRPHPRGFIEVDLDFDGGTAKGTVTLPEGVSGVFSFGGVERELKPGTNTL